MLYFTISLALKLLLWPILNNIYYEICKILKKFQEHCDQNRDLLLKAFVPQKSEDLFTLRNDQKKSAAEGLVELFLEKEENARKEETKTGMWEFLLFRHFSQFLAYLMPL